MEMRAIGGDSGRPGNASAFHHVGHRAVLIDLAALFPTPPHFEGRYQPDGLQIRSVHLGVLTAWSMDDWGCWFGRVTYTVKTTSREEQVTHWVPAWALRPAPHGRSSTTG